MHDPRRHHASLQPYIVRWRGNSGLRIIQSFFSSGVPHCGQRVILRVHRAYTQRDVMRKAVTALAAAATISAATIATPTTAAAGNGWWGGAVIGGFAAGALIASAYARPYPFAYG